MPRTLTTILPLAALALAALPVPEGDKDDDVPVARFSAPVRMQAGGADVRVEGPGFACPSRFDVNGDGHADLVVGQFADGKMHVFHGDAKGNLTPAGFLQAGGDVAEVPGVW